VEWLPVALVVVLAMGFTYTNGFHDAANAVATSVSTRSLTPRIALGLAAVMNLLGGFAGVRVAETIGADIIEVPMGSTGVAICAGALIGATAWNLLTWWRGLPSSSSHALIGGVLGAVVVASGFDAVNADGLIGKVLVPAVVRPCWRSRSRRRSHSSSIGAFVVATRTRPGAASGSDRSPAHRSWRSRTEPTTRRRRWE